MNIKKILFFAGFLFLFVQLGIAQQTDKKPYRLLGETFETELKFESNPVYTSQVLVQIFPNDHKPTANEKMDLFVEVTRGKKEHSLDISSLAAGVYRIEISQSGKGLLYRSTFIKE